MQSIFKTWLTIAAVTILPVHVAAEERTDEMMILERCEAVTDLEIIQSEFVRLHPFGMLENEDNHDTAYMFLESAKMVIYDTKIASIQDFSKRDLIFSLISVLQAELARSKLDEQDPLQVYFRSVTFAHDQRFASLLGSASVGNWSLNSAKRALLCVLRCELANEPQGGLECVESNREQR